MIYLATPYSHPDPEVREVRFEHACVIAGELMHAGHLIFSPIAHTHPIAIRCDLPTDWAYWRRYDLGMLTMCDRLLVAKMEGWEESKGVQAEIEIAKDRGIPIEYLEI